MMSELEVGRNFFDPPALVDEFSLAAEKYNGML